MLTKFIICFIAGIGAGLGTGFAGMIPASDLSSLWPASVFIMAFTAFTGAASHFAIGGMPDLWCLIFCVLSTLLWARIAALFANKASAVTLNRATGIVLAVLGAAIMIVG